MVENKINDFEKASDLKEVKVGGILLKHIHSGNLGISVFKNQGTNEAEHKEFSFITFVLQRSYIKDSKKPLWTTEKINLKKSDLVKLETLIAEARRFMYLDVKKDSSAEITDD